MAQGSGDNSSRCGEPWAEKNQYFLLQGGLFLVIFWTYSCFSKFNVSIFDCFWRFSAAGSAELTVIKQVGRDHGHPDPVSCSEGPRCKSHFVSITFFFSSYDHLVWIIFWRLLLENTSTKLNGKHLLIRMWGKGTKAELLEFAQDVTYLTSWSGLRDGP